MLSNQNTMVLAQKYTHRSVEQNRESRSKSRIIHQLIHNKGGRIHNEERQALQCMVLRNLDRYIQKNQTGVLSHTMYKSKLKMDKNVNVSSETTKLLEENTGSNLFDISLSNVYILRRKDLSLLSRETEAKINKWDYINRKPLQMKESLKKMKRQANCIEENICKQYIL